MITKDRKQAKRIAFAVHDNKKMEVIEWSYFNRDLLSPNEIIATGSAGDTLEGTLNTSVYKLAGVAQGGYQQLATMINEGKVDMLVFFWDTLEDDLEKADIKGLLANALSANILIAHNIPTADFILNSHLMRKEYITPAKEAIAKAS